MKKTCFGIVATALLLTTTLALATEQVLPKNAPAAVKEIEPSKQKPALAPASSLAPIAPKETPTAKAATPKTPAAQVTPQEYERSKLYGEPVYDASGKLQMVLENKSQPHSRDNYVMIRVKNIKPRAGAKEVGRIRVAVWEKEDNYGKEGVKPFRASSHWAKDTVNGEMLFKIGGLEVGKSYSFFTHFDRDNTGAVKRNLLKIPVDPYMFSNTRNQGKGEGIKREGLSAPAFKNTLVKFAASGQEIILPF